MTTPTVEQRAADLRRDERGRWWWLDGADEIAAELVDDAQHDHTVAELRHCRAWPRIAAGLLLVDLVLILIPVDGVAVRLLEVLLSLAATTAVLHGWARRDRLRELAASQLTPTMLRDRGLDQPTRRTT